MCAGQMYIYVTVTTGDRPTAQANCNGQVRSWGHRKNRITICCLGVHILRCVCVVCGVCGMYNRKSAGDRANQLNCIVHCNGTTQHYKYFTRRDLL